MVDDRVEIDVEHDVELNHDVVVSGLALAKQVERVVRAPPEHAVLAETRQTEPLDVALIGSDHAIRAMVDLAATP